MSHVVSCRRVAAVARLTVGCPGDGMVEGGRFPGAGGMAGGALSHVVPDRRVIAVTGLAVNGVGEGVVKRSRLPGRYDVTGVASIAKVIFRLIKKMA